MRLPSLFRQYTESEQEKKWDDPFIDENGEPIEETIREAFKDSKIEDGKGEETRPEPYITALTFV